MQRHNVLRLFGSAILILMVRCASSTSAGDAALRPPYTVHITIQGNHLDIDLDPAPSFCSAIGNDLVRWIGPAGTTLNVIFMDDDNLATQYHRKKNFKNLNDRVSCAGNECELKVPEIPGRQKIYSYVAIVKCTDGSCSYMSDPEVVISGSEIIKRCVRLECFGGGR